MRALGRPKKEWFISEFVRRELLSTNTKGRSVSERITISAAWRATWLRRRVMGIRVQANRRFTFVGEAFGLAGHQFFR